MSNGIKRWDEDPRDFPNRPDPRVMSSDVERADDALYRGLEAELPPGYGEDWGRYGNGPPPGQVAHVSRGMRGPDDGKGPAGDNRRAGRQPQYGKTITIQSPGVNALSNAVGAVQTPVFEDDYSWTLIVQPNKTLQAGQSLIYTITYTVGDVAFTKKFTGPATLAMAKSMMFFGRSMKVDVQLQGNAQAQGGPPATVSVAVARGVVREWSWLCPFWVSQPDATQPSGQLDGAAGSPQPGALLALTGVLTTVPGGAGPWYVLLFDSIGAPAANTAPIPGGFSPPLTGAGQQVSFDDELIAGTLYYANGLYYAISTDPSKFVAPAGGALTISAKIGR